MADDKKNRRQMTAFWKRGCISRNNLMSQKAVDFVHPELNEEIAAIGGEYVFTREEVAKVEGREVLYYTGYAVLDRSCCGMGGCAYGLVAGFVEELRCDKSADGHPLSRVRPVTDKTIRKRIADMLKKEDPYIQVSFMPASGA